MADRNEVVDALNSILYCLYFEEPVPVKDYEMLPAAAEMLSEVRPKEKWAMGYYYVCGACDCDFGIVHGDPLFCPHCGRKVKWK